MKKNVLLVLIGLIFGMTITAGAAYVYTARDISYQPSDESWSVNNVQEALTGLKTDISNINNKVEGIERVYKAGETELVALVSDNSFYTDSNGNYVLSNSDTGRLLLADTSTYKSLPSTSDYVGVFDNDTVSSLNSSGLESTDFEMVYRTESASFNYTFTESGTYIVFSYLNRDNYTSSASLSMKLNNSELGSNTNVSLSTSDYGYLRCKLIKVNKDDVLKLSASYNTNGRIYNFIAKVNNNNAIDLGSKNLVFENYSRGYNPITNKSGDKLVISYLHKDGYTSYYHYSFTRNNMLQGYQTIASESVITLIPLSNLSSDDNISGYSQIGTNGKLFTFSFNIQ